MLFILIYSVYLCCYSKLLLTKGPCSCTAPCTYRAPISRVVRLIYFPLRYSQILHYQCGVEAVFAPNTSIYIMSGVIKSVFIYNKPPAKAS